MATYDVRLYLNTGFNGVNIPDSPARLNACAYIDVDSVVTLQDRGLDHIDVNATWNQVENVDYVRVGSWYYSVPSHGTQMMSVSTARLILISDPITSAGGFSVASDGTVTANFDILDGVTQRCTVASDSWGQYTNDDPLVVPQEPLQIQSNWINSAWNDSDIFIESTVDLCQQGTPSFREGMTYTDDETGETVTVPQTASIPFVNGSPESTAFTIDGNTHTNGTRIFWKTDPHTADDTTQSAAQTIEAGLQVLHSLGQENGSVISQYRVPTNFLGDIDISHTGIQGEIDSEGNASVIGTDQVITNISGASGSIPSGISPDYASPKNKRVLYGQYNKYGMITCAGNSAEFKPEDLGGETAPSISYKSDPRPKGRPYYRFATINGDTDFWRNCLSGSEWENVPLIYQGASGSALTRLNFDNDRRVKSTALESFSKESNLHLAQIVANGVTGTADAMLGGGYTISSAPGENSYTAQANVSSGGLISGLVNTGFAMANNALQFDNAEKMYRVEKANELSQLYQATDVYAPTVNFPYNADILRDVKGNGVLVYKYRMSDNDVARIDKLLTMYGYQTSEQLTPANFGRRKHFDYVACSTVSITGLPKWWCDDIATQLRVGVRVWHELPNTAAYSDNPTRS